MAPHAAAFELRVFLKLALIFRLLDIGFRYIYKRSAYAFLPYTSFAGRLFIKLEAVGTSAFAVDKGEIEAGRLCVEVDYRCIGAFKCKHLYSGSLQA